MSVSRSIDDLYQFTVEETSKTKLVSFDDEVRKYMADPEKDHQKMWTNPKRKNYRLKFLAERLFAIPATSASSERVFSRCGLLMSPLKSRTHEHTLEMLAFLKCNLCLVPVPKPVAETVMISLRK